MHEVFLAKFHACDLNETDQKSFLAIFRCLNLPAKDQESNFTTHQKSKHEKNRLKLCLFAESAPPMDFYAKFSFHHLGGISDVRKFYDSRRHYEWHL